MEKSDLVPSLKADRQALLSAIEGVPEEALTIRGVVGYWSVMDVLAHITACNGETL